MKKVLPIGVDQFEKLVTRNYYFVDKTWMIKEFLDKKAEVNLFTRPRRFGKTLNLSMLQSFFEDTGEVQKNEERKKLFEGLRIMEAGEQYTGEMGKYPVINLTLKSAKQANFELAYACLVEEITREYKRHDRILKKLESEDEYQRFLDTSMGRAKKNEIYTSLRFLVDCLAKVYGKKVMILIDEYDVPLENAYFNGFYPEMVTLIRSLFESALKTNPSLECAVITGCLRITKESIFTGLNNLNVVSILSNQYDEYFGFTQDEVDALLDYYDQKDARDIVKKWYDGYLFGETNVYNPWSVINYVTEACAGGQSFPKPYWSNTSSNSIVRDLVENATFEVREELEQLIEGGTIEKQVHEEITYDDIYETEDNLWNFLFFTGYLKKVRLRMEEDVQYITLSLPNTEVKGIYRSTILKWFEKSIRQKNLTPLYQALEQGDTDRIEEILTDVLSETISFYDYAESYYHGFVAGLLRGNGKYSVKSNRESGLGRPDLILRTPNIRRGRAFAIEIKVADSLANLEKACEEALNQAETRKYRSELEQEGFQNIMIYGFSFWKKEAAVMADSQNPA